GTSRNRAVATKSVAPPQQKEPTSHPSATPTTRIHCPNISRPKVQNQQSAQYPGQKDHSPHRETAASPPRRRTTNIQ
ncbi:hypothetical protein CRENBAI_026873, partial [Crenichthys baileyi]